MTKSIDRAFEDDQETPLVLVRRPPAPADREGREALWTRM